MLFQDFILDNEGDLKLDTGDLEIGLSDQAHIKDIFNSYPGWWRNYPYVGVGAFNYIESDGEDQQLIQDGKTQLTADGYIVNFVTPIREGGVLTCDTDASRP